MRALLNFETRYRIGCTEAPSVVAIGRSQAQDAGPSLSEGCAYAPALHLGGRVASTLNRALSVAIRGIAYQTRRAGIGYPRNARRRHLSAFKGDN